MKGSKQYFRGKTTRFDDGLAFNFTYPLIRNPTDISYSAYILRVTSVAPDMEK